METIPKITGYYHIIKSILSEYASIPYRYNNLKQSLIISEDKKHYLLITQGWDKGIRVHGCVTHLEIIDDKIWIQRDGLEDGIANDLVAAGIPKSQIVLGFHPPEIRPYTEYAVE
jgi:hypothetical protein